MPTRSKTPKPKPTQQRRSAAKSTAKSLAKRREPLYRLRISLRDITPEIWRAAEIPGAISLSELHLVLQTVMGWENSHLHEFRVEGATYGEPSPDGDDFVPVIDEADFTLSDIVARHGSRFAYAYDFGDDWEHDVVVEEILTSGLSKHAPRCVDGARACPPEDVGGPYGYADYVEAMRNRRHPEHRRWLEWRGEFDPEKFDLEAVNRVLGSSARARTKTGPKARRHRD